MRAEFLWLAAAACCGCASALPVGPALDRAAVASRAASQAVLLAGARAGTRLVAVGERGIVVLSDDDGRHWRQASSPVSVTLTAVQFTDAKVGYAVGHGGLVLSTADGGQTWTRRLDGLQAARIAVAAARASGDAAQERDAQRLVDEGADKPLLDLHFFDARHGVVVGAYGLAFETRDGGASWTSWMPRVPNPKGLHLYAIRAQGDTVVIAGEQGLVCRSSDGGATFARLDTGYKGSFFTAELPSPGEIVVGGLRGNLWRSVDAGANWAQVEGTAPTSFIASTTRDGEVLLADQSGAFFSERNGRVTNLQARLGPVNGLLALGDGGLLALTFKGAVIVPAARGVPATATAGGTR